jgi:hypothetical protein
MNKPGKRVKEFDCVAMKHAVQSEIYEITKDMSNEERRAWFRDQAENGPLGEFYRALLERSRRQQGKTAPR